jgi:putative addiction module killer protein
MFEIRQTERFAKWFSRLRDRTVRARIQARIDRARFGNLGDVKSVAAAQRMPSTSGPATLDFARRGDRLIVLLCGGDKSSQQKDIREATSLVAEL